MKKSVKRRFLEILRSGRFAQTRGFLHVLKSEYPTVRPGYCCLGLLCMLAPNKLLRGNEKLDGKPVLEMGGIQYEYLSGRQVRYPNDAVLKWAGLTSQQAHMLASLNDSGYSFRDIANHVEALL